MFPLKKECKTESYCANRMKGDRKLRFEVDSSTQAIPGGTLTRKKVVPGAGSTLRYVKPRGSAVMLSK